MCAVSGETAEVRPLTRSETAAMLVRSLLERVLEQARSVGLGQIPSGK
jgi:hypothetical protein